jgi:hypothetical protein
MQLPMLKSKGHKEKKMIEPHFIEFAETGFSFSLIFLPLGLGLLHTKLKGGKKTNTIYLYYIIIGVGMQGLVTGIMQILHPSFVANYVQWPYSPFLLELGLANLSYGILGILSPWLSRGWQTATAVGYALFLLFTGSGHLIDLIKHGSHPGNSGAFLYSDLGVALALLSLVILQHKTL